MMQRSRLTSPVVVTLLAVLVGPAAVSAQSTWVVDASGGAGSHFQTVDAALNKAVDGDKIIVRSGTYGAMAITKAVTVVGEPGAVIEMSDYVTGSKIQSIPIGKQAAVHGLRFTTKNIVFSFVSILEVSQCAGRVVLDDLEFDNMTAAPYAGVSVVDSAAVSIEGCTIPRVTTITNSRVVATDTSFYYAYIGTTSVRLSKSSVTLVQCTAGGGIGGHGAAFSAIVCSGSRLELRGDAASAYGGGNNSGWQAPALLGDGNSQLVYSPAIRFSTPIQSNFSKVTVRSAPWLSHQGGKLGSNLDLALGSPPGHDYFLFVGLPIEPIAIPSWGELWIDPRFYFLIATGKQSAAGTTAIRRTVPTTAGLLGLSLTYQALSGAGTLEFSNASTTVLYAR